MKCYSVMTMGWDYKHKEKIEDFKQQGCHSPYEVEGLVGSCGSLYPYITTKKGAVNFVKNLKSQFPYVCFDLMVGNNWGELELVQSF